MVLVVFKYYIGSNSGGNWGHYHHSLCSLSARLSACLDLLFLLTSKNAPKYVMLIFGLVTIVWTIKIKAISSDLIY